MSELAGGMTSVAVPAEKATESVQSCKKPARKRGLSADEGNMSQMIKYSHSPIQTMARIVRDQQRGFHAQQQNNLQLAEFFTSYQTHESRVRDVQVQALVTEKDQLTKSNLALALEVAVLKEQTRLRTEELNAIADKLADVTDDRDTLFKQTLDIKAKNDRLEEQGKMIKKLRDERDATYKSYLEMEAQKKLLFKENTHVMQERDSLLIQKAELTRAKARTDEVAKPRTSDDEVGTRSDEQQDTGCYAYVCHAGY
jgi:hypothetical protein